MAVGCIAYTPKPALTREDVVDNPLSTAHDLPVSADQFRKLYETVGKMNIQTRLEHFTEKPSDMLKNYISYHTVNGGNGQGEFDPLPNDGRPYWYNVITFGTANRCTQLAFEAFGPQYDGFFQHVYDSNSAYIRNQHDNNVGKWRRIITTNDEYSCNPSSLTLENGFEFWKDISYDTYYKIGRNIHLDMLLNVEKGTKYSNICKLPHAPGHNTVFYMPTTSGKVIRIRFDTNGYLRLDDELPTRSYVGSDYFKICFDYICKI